MAGSASNANNKPKGKGQPGRPRDPLRCIPCQLIGHHTTCRTRVEKTKMVAKLGKANEGKNATTKGKRKDLGNAEEVQVELEHGNDSGREDGPLESGGNDGDHHYQPCRACQESRIICCSCDNKDNLIPLASGHDAEVRQGTTHTSRRTCAKRGSSWRNVWHSCGRPINKANSPISNSTPAVMKLRRER